MKSIRKRRQQARRRSTTRLRVEELEDRRLLATIIVDSIDDDISIDGSITLREAIIAANNDAIADAVEGVQSGSGDDTIVFDSALSGGTINLSFSGIRTVNELVVTDSVVVDASSLIDGLTIDANGASRIFSVGLGDFTISALTLTGGRTTDDNSSASDFTESGGAILHADTTSTLTINNSTLAHNSTEGLFADGGAIAARGDLVINQSTISNNTTAGDGADGAGIWASGTTTITRSTVADNHGLFNTSVGGGVFHGNSALSIDNSIVADNSAAGGNPDLAQGVGALAVDFSLIGDTSDLTGAQLASINAGTGNRLDISSGLAPLDYYGGPFQTHALMLNSLAIDAGDPSITANPAEFDQRGDSFVRVVDGNIVPGERVDMGAYESQFGSIPSLVVDSLVDESDADYSVGDLSLREAIQLANIVPGLNTITFDATLSGQTISLLSTELEVIESLAIDSSNLVGGITIVAPPFSRIFDVSAGDFTVTGVTLTGGRPSAGEPGGAIRHSSATGSVTVDRSTIHGNDTGASGGAVHAVGDATFTGSTISGNSTSGDGADGGAIWVDGALTIIQSTITDNHAVTNASGGGIFHGDGTLTIDGSIVSGNTAANGNPDVRHGAGLLDVDYTLIGDTTDLSAGQLIDINAGFGNLLDIDPLLTPLSNNGGLAHTHSLNLTSPAIDAGDPAIAFNPTEFDQRGNPFLRVVDGDATLGAIVDMGSFESQVTTFPTLVVDTAIDELDGNYTAGDFSLREAIDLANISPGADTIAFDSSLSGQTIPLSLGELRVFESLTINAGDLVNGLTIDGQQSSRIFHVLDGDFDLTGLTLTEGRSGPGAGIRHVGASGSLSVSYSTISSNVSTPSLLVGGAGIHSVVDVTLDHVTVSGNVVSNSSSGDGGGVYVEGALNIMHSTITRNRAGSRFGVGGGIYHLDDTLSISNSIIADNSAGVSGGTNPDLRHGIGILNVDYSLIGNTGGISAGQLININAGTGNLLDVNAQLAPLADNGGRAPTNALILGSPAIDAGDPGIAVSPTESDQRGGEFLRVADGDTTAGAVIDMGAYESQFAITPNLIVDSLTDESDNDFGPGDLSLREAISIAHLISGPDVITFDAGLDGGTIMLELGNLVIAEDLIIDATGLSNGLTIDAQDSSRLFYIASGAIDVTIANMSLIGGLSFTRGGAIFSSSSATLTIDQSTISGNRAVGYSARGGGVYARGNLTVADSVITGNSTDGLNARGGGLYARGNLSIADSVISGNSTLGSISPGGGVYSLSVLTVTGSVLSGNSTTGAVSPGGGLFATQLTLANSTVSGNMTAGDYSEGGGIGGRLISTTDSTVSGNWTTGRDSGGGGIHATIDATLTNSTISGNSTTHFDSDFGGVFSGRDLTVTSSTITNNHALHFLARYGGVANNDDTVIVGSIVAGNTSGQGRPDVSPGAGTFSVEYSVIGTGGMTANQLQDINSGQGNLLNVDPQLGPLADNGGPTQTHELPFGSPALDAGDPAFAAPPDFDQRGMGFPRVQDGNVDGASRIDIGAFELVPSFARILGRVFSRLEQEWYSRHW